MRTLSRLDATSSMDRGDALADLEADHRQVESLFARASLCHGLERVAAARQATAALQAHAELEETVVYPVIAGALPGAPWLVDTSLHDHDEIRVMIAALEDATDDVTVLAALRALQLLVQAHVAVEEGEIFPAFRQAVDADALADLGAQAAAARKQDRTGTEVQA